MEFGTDREPTSSGMFAHLKAVKKVGNARKRVVPIANLI
jgi:hypothetical protein